VTRPALGQNSFTCINLAADSAVQIQRFDTLIYYWL
jgi:hypothetical protein